VRCGTKLKTGQIDGQVVDGMAAQHEGVRLRLKDTPPSLPIPTPPAAPYNPPLTTDPVRRQVAFDCPHCGINIQGVAYTGESVKCLTCGGYVIVPEPAKASIIVRVGGAFLLICFLLVVIGWFLGLTSPSSQSQSGTTASESQAPSVHALGADDALSLYGRGDMDNALQASKISRRIQSDPEYERSFRDQWRYLDNKAALEYQRATGR
jgi:hypothetical protein